MTNGDKFLHIFGYRITDIPYVTSGEWERDNYEPPAGVDHNDLPKPIMNYTLSELFHELYDEMNERSQ